MTNENDKRKNDDREKMPRAKDGAQNPNTRPDTRNEDARQGKGGDGRRDTDKDHPSDMHRERAPGRTAGDNRGGGAAPAQETEPKAGRQEQRATTGREQTGMTKSAARHEQTGPGRSASTGHNRDEDGDEGESDVRGQLGRRWDRLTEDDLGRVEEDNEALTDVLQQRYGMSKDQAEKDSKSFYATSKKPGQSPGSSQKSPGQSPGRKPGESGGKPGEQRGH